MNGGMRAAVLTRVAALSLSVSACCRCEPPGPPEPADSASTAPHGFNASPRIDAVYATLDGVRLRVVPPGSTVRLESRATDPDGDPLQYRWEAAPGGGALVPAAAGAAIWRPGPAVGVRRLSLRVADGRGGVARRTLALAVDTVLGFSGRVVDRAGRPIADARVYVADQQVRTDAGGRFDLRTPRTTDTRYVLTIDKEGYGLYSQVLDGPVDGVALTLTPGTTVVADPRQPIAVADDAAAQCAGPLSARVDWSLYPRQREARVFDADGEPWSEPVPPEVTEALAIYAQAIPCSPGISISLPANGLVDATGQVPAGPVEVTVATADTAAAAQSRVGMEGLPTEEWVELRTFARFPQGLPAEVDVATLRPNPLLVPPAGPDGG